MVLISSIVVALVTRIVFCSANPQQSVVHTEDADALHSLAVQQRILGSGVFIEAGVGISNNITFASQTSVLDEIPPDDVENDEDPDWELDTFEIEWGSLDNYSLLNKLGEGEYGDVYLSIDKRSNLTCVLKMLKPVSLRAVKREVKILQHLKDGPNIVKLVDVATDAAGNMSALVMEYVNNTYYRDLYSNFNDIDVRFYMFQLLQALDFAHSKGVMHRDIKPHNLMIDHQDRKLRLIDWGLADFYDEQYAYTTSIASRFWRAPEILVDYEWYNLSSDMWAFGCMFAALIFGIEPFFHGRYNNANQLIKIAEVLGTQDLFHWLDKYEIELPSIYSNVSSWHERRDWTEFITWRNRRRANDDALDLLGKVLVYDHNERLNASQALAHPYFDTIRSEAVEHEKQLTEWPTWLGATHDS